MTPAERLIAAADLLEKRAGEATPGPWSQDEPILTVDGISGFDVDGPTGGYVARLASKGDADYIATMHPEVCKALGEWLRELSSDVSFFGVTEQNAYNVRHGLAVADLLLAGTS